MPQDFRQLFERAVTAALATSTVLVVGCADEIDLDGFEPAPCEPLQNIAPAIEVDYAELISSDFGGGSSDATGTACATAADQQTCEEALESARNEPYASRYLVTTRADAVEKWATHEELIEFLGAIDSEGDAVIVAWHAGFSVGCYSLEHGAIKAVGDNYEIIATKMTQDCSPVVVMQYRLRVTAAGDLTILEEVELSREDGVCVGRRPDGLQNAADSYEDPQTKFWSVVAHLEAAAVCAFENLAAELRGFGAPDALVAAALEAAEDESRHAIQTAGIAARLGGDFLAPIVEPTPNRSLEDFALENATEGCVRETFGAAFGAFQARNAQDPEIATAMATISADETRHSELSWRIAAWLDGVLEPRALGRIKEAQRMAALQIKRECRMPVPLVLVVNSGVPAPNQAMAIWATLEQELWAA